MIQAEGVSMKVETKHLLSNLHEEQTRLYERFGDFKKALGYAKKLSSSLLEEFEKNHAQAVAQMQAKFNVEQKKREAELLKEKNQQLEKAYSDLESAQKELISAERMAALGKIAQQIAHEVQNPLNFVNNFSGINIEILQEVLSKAESGTIDADDVEDLKELINNSRIINEHGTNVAGIVSKLLSKTWTQDDEDLHYFNPGENNAQV